MASQLPVRYFRQDSGLRLRTWQSVLGPEMKRRLLLVSNSTLHGGGYLQHCQQNVAQFFGR